MQAITFTGSAAPRVRIVLAVLCLAMPAMAARAATQPGPPAYHNVRDHGAAGDGESKETAAIQRAIDAAGSAGGGTVYFPPGTYLSGTLFMKDGVRLYLDAGATLLGATAIEDYPIIPQTVASYTSRYVCQALIYGENVRDIAIIGAGTIDGQGDADVFKVKREGRQYGLRPYLIRFVACRGVLVQGITLRDSPMWVQHYLACDDVVIQGIKVWSHAQANNDMIDIDGCERVRISEVAGDTEDDAITLKSTSDRVCRDVTVTNCTVSSHCSAIKFGTESNGGFQNITVTNCAVRPSQVKDIHGRYVPGIAGIALEIVDGGVMDRVTISNVVIEGTRSPIFLRLGNRARPFREDMPKPGIGAMRNISISNVVATGTGPIGCAIAGLPGHPIQNVSLSHVKLTFPGGGTLADAGRPIPEHEDKYPECTMFGTLPAYGFYARHVDGLTFDDVDVRWTKPDARPALVCDDVRDLRVNGLRGHAMKEGAPAMVLTGVQTALIQGCIAPMDASAFLRLTGASDRVSVIGNDLSATARPFEFADGAAEAALFQAANRMQK